MFNQVIDCDEHIEVATCFIEVIFEDTNTFDNEIYDLHERIDVIGEGGELIKFVGGYDLFF